MQEICDNLIKLLEEVKNNWNRVTVPESKSITDITNWLDENCTAQYYFDTMFITQDYKEISQWYNPSKKTLPVLYLESNEDMIFYNLTWNKYD